jgi:excisionase family DNA binding protein
MEGEPETLTIKRAAALLGVHPNTVRNRIKAGVYEAEKVITEHGETFMLSRSELEKRTPTNTVPSASQAPLSQSLPIVREVMRSALEPFVRELGEVREELGRERERRENAERRVEELERRLEPEREEAQEPAQRRPWWRKIFSG